MRNRLSRLLLAFVVLAVPLPVIADPISIVAFTQSSGAAVSTIDRSDVVNNSGQNTLNSRVEMVGPGGEGLLSAASQLISVASTTEGHFAGQGSADASRIQAGSAFAEAFAVAVFSIVFDVTEAQRFDFAGNFQTLEQDADVIFQAQLFRFDDPGGTALTELFGVNAHFPSIGSPSGVADPGRYLFSVVGNATSVGSVNSGTRRGRLDFDFDLRFSDASATSPTSEPASMMLLGTGLVGLVARRRFTRKNGGVVQGAD